MHIPLLEDRKIILSEHPTTGEPQWDRQKGEKFLNWQQRHRLWRENQGKKTQETFESEKVSGPNYHSSQATHTIVAGQVPALSRADYLAKRHRHTPRPQHYNYRIHRDCDGTLVGEFSGFRGTAKHHYGVVSPGFYARLGGKSKGDLTDKIGHFILEGEASSVVGNMNNVVGSAENIFILTRVDEWGEPERIADILRKPEKLMRMAIQPILDETASYEDQEEAYNQAFDLYDRLEWSIRPFQCHLTNTWIGEWDDPRMIDRCKRYLTQAAQENVERMNRDQHGRRPCQLTLVAGNLKVYYHKQEDCFQWPGNFLTGLRSYSHFEVAPELDKRDPAEKKPRPIFVPTPSKPDEEFWKDLVKRKIVDPPYLISWEEDTIIRKPRISDLGEEVPNSISVGRMEHWVREGLSDNEILSRVRKELSLVRKKVKEQTKQKVLAAEEKTIAVLEEVPAPAPVVELIAPPSIEDSPEGTDVAVPTPSLEGNSSKTFWDTIGDLGDKLERKLAGK